MQDGGSGVGEGSLRAEDKFSIMLSSLKKNISYVFLSILRMDRPYNHPDKNKLDYGSQFCSWIQFHMCSDKDQSIFGLNMPVEGNIQN